jgi:hypothetical protein
MYRSIKQQNSLNNRALTVANTNAFQQEYGAECIYCREVYVNKKKQRGYVCSDCNRKTFK